MKIGFFSHGLLRQQALEVFLLLDVCNSRYTQRNIEMLTLYLAFPIKRHDEKTQFFKLSGTLNGKENLS